VRPAEGLVRAPTCTRHATFVCISFSRSFAFSCDLAQTSPTCSTPPSSIVHPLPSTQRKHFAYVHSLHQKMSERVHFHWASCASGVGRAWRAPLAPTLIACGHTPCLWPRLARPLSSRHVTCTTIVACLLSRTHKVTGHATTPPPPHPPHSHSISPSPLPAVTVAHHGRPVVQRFRFVRPIVQVVASGADMRGVCTAIGRTHP
jgi:hypothetical protein